MGRQLLHEVLEKPLAERTKIEERHECVQFFLEFPQLTHQIRVSLIRVPNTLKLAQKLRRTEFDTVEEAVKLYRVVMISIGLLQYLENSSPVEACKKLIGSPLRETLSKFSKFVEMVEKAVNMTDGNTSKLRLEWDPESRSLEEKRNELELQMRDIARGISKLVSVDVQLVQTPNPQDFGAELNCLRVTKKHQSLVQNSDECQAVKISKNEYFFTTSKLQALHSDYLEISEVLTKIERGYISEIMEVCRGYLPPLEEISEILGLLDLLTNFSVVAQTSAKHFCCPVLTEEKEIEMKNSRHVLVEQFAKSFLPNDVLMTPETRFQIVTGPNMSGKSTYIRQIAICVILSQIGCFIPCDYARLPIFDRIVCRVGASDCQTEGVSTFMAEMHEAGEVIRTASKNSLVLVDELGRGTSTRDGFGLSYAIAKEILRIRCFCLFATHFHELHLLEKEEGVGCRHVATLVDEKSLTFLFKVETGIVNQSYGLNVAEMVGFPQKVLDAARKHVYIQES